MFLELANQLFPDEPHHIAGYHEEICKVFPFKGRLLDLGCGRNTDQARYRNPYREIWGTDFQRHSELLAPEWFRQLGPAGEIPFPGSFFDLVTSCWVCEHLRRPDLFLKEAARVLRPGGHLVAHTISGHHYVTWARRFLGLLPHQAIDWMVLKLYNRSSEDTFPTYYRLNSEHQFRREARRSGLRLVSLRTYADQGYFRFWPPAHRLALRADRFIEDRFPGWGRLYLTVTLEKLARLPS